MATVLLSSVGTIGNVIPFLALGSALSTKGHQVCLITNGVHVTKFANAEAEIEMVGIDTDDEYRMFKDDLPSLNHPAELPRLYREYYLPKVTLEFEELSKRVRAPETLIIANEAPGIAARLVAERHQIPLISIFTYPNHISAGAIFDELIMRVLKDDIDAIRAQLGFAHKEELRVWWKSPDRYWALWPRWYYERSLQWPARSHAMGFFYWQPAATTLPRNFEEFASNGRRPVLITGGTGGMVGHEFFDMAVTACADVGVPAVIVGNARVSIKPPGEVLQYTDVPSLEALMPYCSATIHHGGMGTIGQSLRHGLPQLALADGGDRPANASSIERLGVGVGLIRTKWNRGYIGEALGKITFDQAIRSQCDAYKAQIARETYIENACVCVERLLKQGSRARIAKSGRTTKQPQGANPILDVLLHEIAGLSAERKFILVKMLEKGSKPI